MKGSATEGSICDSEEETELINRIPFEPNPHLIGSDGFTGPFCLSV